MKLYYGRENGIFVQKEPYPYRGLVRREKTAFHPSRSIAQRILLFLISFLSDSSIRRRSAARTAFG